MFPDGMRSGAIIHQFQGVFYGGIFSHAPGEETWHQGRQQTILVQRTEKLFTVIGPIPLGVEVVPGITPDTDIVHLFATKKTGLRGQLTAARKKIKPDAALWVSWPKKAAKVPTDITEDTIRELALPLGLVDIKVCAVDETWSGLKLVIRKEHRKSLPPKSIKSSR